MPLFELHFQPLKLITFITSPGTSQQYLHTFNKHLTIWILYASNKNPSLFDLFHLIILLSCYIFYIFQKKQKC